MRIDYSKAEAAIRKAANKEESAIDPVWREKIERLSRLCLEGNALTHIAFFGTAVLAKHIAPNADLIAIKPTHAKGNPNAFSARTLCHNVWVPVAAELGISIGVTGREPLNNQPYFRMKHLNDGTPVHAKGRPAFDYMLTLVSELMEGGSDNAEQALEAFVLVRMGYQPRYRDLDGNDAITPKNLADVVSGFVAEASENGKRAQAVAAGLIDVFAGTDRVVSGRINDPSRRHPGDVCVRSTDNNEEWEKAIEVRDKPVSLSDAQIFAKKCLDMKVREAAVLMVAADQPKLDIEALNDWAKEFGIGVTLFHGWQDFVEQILFWAHAAKPLAAKDAVQTIYNRLIEVEASEDAILSWNERCSK